MTLREMNMGEMDWPNEYDFLKLAIQRGLVTEQDEIAQFKRIESGRKGENAFAEIMRQFGQENWLFKRNLWLHDFSDFECDYLLITTHCVCMCLKLRITLASLNIEMANVNREVLLLHIIR